MAVWQLSDSHSHLWATVPVVGLRHIARLWRPGRYRARPGPPLPRPGRPGQAGPAIMIMMTESSDRD